jgi:hypothetical protein
MAGPTIPDTVMSSVAPASTTVRAAPQGGVLEGLNPVQYNASNPIILFIIQVRIPDIFFERTTQRS